MANAQYTKQEAARRRKAALLEAHERRKEAAEQRRAALPVIETASKVQPGKMGRPAGSRDFAFEYPLCPRCHSRHVKRAGFASSESGRDEREQRFKCLDCGRTFGNGVVIVDVPAAHSATCYRCGSAGTLVCFTRYVRRASAGGAIVYCPVCCKKVRQGGPNHLKLTMCVLLKRVNDLGVSDQLIRAEVLQQATLDVMEGRAYTWNVPLDVKAALRRAHGGSDTYAGSDHSAFRRQQGHNPRTD